MNTSFYWLIALAIFLIIEVVTLGLTTVWFAGGAFAAFIAALLGVEFFPQLFIFFAVSLVLLNFTRPIAIKYLNGSREKTNYQGLLNMEGRVVETIDNSQQEGTVNLNGQDWTARAMEEGIIIPQGTLVYIKDIQGVKLIVTEKKEEI